MPAVIRRLEPSDLALYRVVRLEALLHHPEAFLSAYEDEAAEPLDSYKRMIATAPSATFGCFVGGVLVGIAGLTISPRLKLRHKGTIVGVYLQPAHRSRGLARQLIQTVIEEARQVGIVGLHLHVTVGNEAAERLYRALGFRRYGVEERALRIAGRFFDEAMMVLDLD